MASLAKVTLIGNLGRDPELKYTPQGTPLCQFTMATSEKKKDKTGNMNEITTWFRITVWGKMADACSQYLAKGRPVYVEGRLRQEQYQDRDGQTKYSLEVNASEVQFLGSRDDAGARSNQPPPHQDYQQRPSQQAPPPRQQPAGGLPLGSEVSDEDIPF